MTKQKLVSTKSVLNDNGDPVELLFFQCGHYRESNVPNFDLTMALKMSFCEKCGK